MISVCYFFCLMSRHKRGGLESQFFVKSLQMRLILSIKICRRRIVWDSFTGIYTNILGGICPKLFILFPETLYFPLFLTLSAPVCSLMLIHYLFLVWILTSRKLLFFIFPFSKATNVLLLLGKVASYALNLTGFFYCRVTSNLRPEESMAWPSSE